MTPYVSQHSNHGTGVCDGASAGSGSHQRAVIPFDLKITSETFVHIVMAHLILKHLRPNRGGQDDWRTRPR